MILLLQLLLEEKRERPAISTTTTVMELHLRVNDSTTSSSSSSFRQQMNPAPRLHTTNNQAIVEHDRNENKENSAVLPSWTMTRTFLFPQHTTATFSSYDASNSSTLCQQAWLLYKEHEIGVLLFLIGVWNNGPYVIMLASAKDVSEGGVALVYIANILPGMYDTF